MKLDRRDLLLSGPAAIFGLQFVEALQAQAQATAPVDPDVRNFWAHGMGVPSNTLVGADRTRGRQNNGPAVSDYGREPLFLHHDPHDNVLLTQEEIQDDKLPDSGSTNISFQLVRMRLNHADEQQFRDYTSGGLYVELAQTPAASASLMSDVEALASSVFSAIFPSSGKGGSDSKGGSKKSSSTSSGKGKGFFPQSTAQAAAGSGTGNAVQLQQAKQAQSLTLPNGAGRTSFACFAKDRRKTLFGKFIDVFGELAASPMLSYLPMLSLPAVGVSTLNAVRSLVGNLQAHGQNQHWIMMSTPTDVATTKAAVNSTPTALKLPPGNYVLIPKEQSSAMKDQVKKLKVLDGYLVPQHTTSMEVFDAYPTTAPDVSYITVSVGVQAQKGKAG